MPGLMPENSQDLSFFNNFLEENTAFCKEANYVDSTIKELAREEPLNPIYSWNSPEPTESKTTRVLKQVFSVVVFPVGIYKLLKRTVWETAIIPAASPLLMRKRSDWAQQIRQELDVEKSKWAYKRITIEVNGNKVDAMIVGKESTLDNGRWVLASNPNAGCYEHLLDEGGTDFRRMLSNLKGNALIFNHPGVGSSKGSPNQKTLVNTHQAMLSFLEDKQGVGAKEIVTYGRSIGAGIQAQSLKSHQFKKDISYVVVSDRSFSSLSAAFAGIIRRSAKAALKALKLNVQEGSIGDSVSLTLAKVGAFAVRFFGFEMDSLEASKNLPVPQIILQTADLENDDQQIAPLIEEASELVKAKLSEASIEEVAVEVASLIEVRISDIVCKKYALGESDKKPEILFDSKKIIDDKVIAKEASLGQAILDDVDPKFIKTKKIIIGIESTHNASLKKTSEIANAIKNSLRKPSNAN